MFSFSSSLLHIRPHFWWEGRRRTGAVPSPPPDPAGGEPTASLRRRWQFGDDNGTLPFDLDAWEFFDIFMCICFSFHCLRF
jgi:hypothetical protein